MERPGPLLASGRDTDVFELGPGQVLRRYRAPGRSTEREAEVMRVARSCGFPVPVVHETRGQDLVMERVTGPTMLADLARRPWRVFHHARLLAALHARLHRIPAPGWLPHRFGPGDALIHLDLHPDNVVLTPAGPVVIDWPNAAAGPPAADLAYTWIVLATSLVPGDRRQQIVTRAGQSLFTRAFLAHVDPMELMVELPAVARHRFDDRNVHEAERLAIERLVRRAGAQLPPP